MAPYHCQKGGTIFEKDKWWCRIHAPSKVAEGRQRMEARIEAEVKVEIAERKERLRQRRAYPLLLAALQNLISLSSPFFTDEVQMLALSEARAAVAKAKGGTDESRT